MFTIALFIIAPNGKNNKCSQELSEQSVVLTLCGVIKKEPTYLSCNTKGPQEY
jgi:hypothetical protein